MFGAHHHYVPVLKWKRAEQAALHTLAPPAKSALTPLLEIVSIPADLDSGDQTKTLEEHVDPAINKIPIAWGTADPFFLDPAQVAGDLSATGMDGANYVFSEAHQLALPFVPVTGVYRPVTEQAAAVAHKHHGLCLRVTHDDITQPGLAADIAAFMTTNKLNGQDVDMVIDIGAIYGQSSLVVSAAFTIAMQAVPNLTAWRTLTVVASAFAENMGVVPTLGSMTIERSEWLAWASLYGRRAQTQQIPRLPTFGDYGIQHPTGVEGYDPRYMPMSAAIRYTLTDRWLLIKGQSTKTVSASIQFPRLAAQLIAHRSFYGAQHCSGCAEANACAGGAPGKGSPEAWRRIGTSHHLAVTTGQLASLAYP